jgi:hypothetical protein
LQECAALIQVNNPTGKWLQTQETNIGSPSKRYLVIMQGCCNLLEFI